MAASPMPGPDAATITVERSSHLDRRAGVARLAARCSAPVLVLVLAVLNAADLVTTRLVLDRGGDESNPIMRPFVDGMWRAVALKVVCLAIVAVLVRRCPRSPRVLVALCASVLWYGFVVGWNLVGIARVS